MAFKIKDNLDLNGYILQNFCIDNYDSLDSISDKGLGRAVFLTGNATDGKYHHVNIYDGTGFRALAYLDEIANNEAFVALQEKVALLAGDVDTDAIINNMKEVSNFLAGFAEDANLMSVLDGKLDKSGGTITGGSEILEIKRNGPYMANIKFSNTDGALGSLGFAWANNPAFFHTDGNYYTLIHSGNIGEYALKVDGSNKMSKGILFSDRTLTEALSTRGTGIEMFKLVDKSSVSPTGSVYFSVLNAVSSYSGLQLAVFGGAESTLYYRKIGDSGTWSDWKTIAFTDSTVASATKLETARTIWGQSFDGTGNVSGDLHLNQSDIYWHNDKANYCIESVTRTSASPYLKVAHLGGIEFHTGMIARMILNSSGNVLIGITDDNGAKLQVNGGIYADTHIRFNPNASYGVFRGNLISARLSSEDVAVASPKFYIGATCLIGDTKVVDSEARMLVYGKTYIEGDLHVSGNIIADGEVSAGGPGEEGSAGAGSGSQMYATTIAEGTTTKDIAHGLGTDDIVISIYEKDSTSGLWNMVLTDIEITDANNIRVAFGSATTVEHKVVIFGAVA